MVNGKFSNVKGVKIFEENFAGIADIASPLIDVGISF